MVNPKSITYSKLFQTAYKFIGLDLFWVTKICFRFKFSILQIWIFVKILKQFVSSVIFDQRSKEIVRKFFFANWNNCKFLWTLMCLLFRILSFFNIIRHCRLTTNIKIFYYDLIKLKRFCAWLRGHRIKLMLSRNLKFGTTLLIWEKLNKF